MPHWLHRTDQEKPGDRHGSAYPRQCNSQAGRSVGCESRSRHFRVSSVQIVTSHQCALFRRCELERQCRDSACREPAAEKCTCHSFRRRATLPPGWNGPLHTGRRPCPCRPAGSQLKKADTAPPVGGHHSHIPVDSGNRLGLVLLDFASSQLSTRFASELPRCPETCRSRQATRQTVPGRRVCDSSPGLESIILPPPVPRPLPQANLSISEPANLSRGEPPDFPD